LRGEYVERVSISRRRENRPVVADQQQCEDECICWEINPKESASLDGWGGYLMEEGGDVDVEVC